MPPKVKITEEEILQAALEIIRSKGIAGVNARDIGKALGCSVQPVFRNFQNMEKLKEALYRKAEEALDSRMRGGMESHRIPFLGIGLAYIQFAREEKNLFKLLFMSDEFKGKSVLDMARGEDSREILGIIAGMTGLDITGAQQLFLAIWLLTHGIAALMATNSCEMSPEEITGLLMDAFGGMKMKLIGRGKE